MAANNNGMIVLMLGLVGLGAWVYTQQRKPVNNPALITAPPTIPYMPVDPNARQASTGIVGGLGGLAGMFGSMFSGSSSGTTWAGMPTGVNRQGQATPLLSNNAFVSNM